MFHNNKYHQHLTTRLCIAMLLAAFVQVSCSGPDLAASRIFTEEYSEQDEGIHTLTLPESATLVRSLDLYAVPTGRVSFTDNPYYIPPARSTILSKVKPPAIKQLGADYWMVIYEPPSKVWQIVRNYFDENWQLEEEEPEQGIVASSWTAAADAVPDNKPDNKQDAEQLVRYYAVVEAGLLLGSSEVKFYKQRRHTNGDTEVVYELESLKEVLDYIANAEQTATSLRAQVLDYQAKVVSEITSEGAEYIKADLDYDRTWSAVTLALRSAEIEIIRADKATGEMLVRYTFDKLEQRWPQIDNMSYDYPQSSSVDGFGAHIRKPNMASVQRATVVSERDRLIKVLGVSAEKTLVWVEQRAFVDPNQTRLTALILQNMN